MTIGPGVRTGGQVAFFTLLLGLVGCGSESGTPMDPGDEVQPPGPVITLPFTLDALRTGNIDKILHCSGPFWNPEEHDGYLAALPAETRPLMVRFGTSLTPTERFTSDLEVPAVQAKVETLLADAAARGKPVIIPESAPSGQDMEDPATWDWWFAPYFELVRSDPNIKGFCYSNTYRSLRDRSTSIGSPGGREGAGSSPSPRSHSPLRPQHAVHLRRDRVQLGP